MKTKERIKDLLIVLAVVLMIISISIIAYGIAYHYSEPNESMTNGLTSLVSAFMLQIVGLMFYAATR